jgi:hypothetical protein
MKLVIAEFKEKEGNELLCNGLIRINPNKNEYASLMLIDASIKINNGFLNDVNKVGFVTGRTDVLKKLVERADLKPGDNFSEKVFDAKIVTIEKIEDEVDSETDFGFRIKINPSTQCALQHDKKDIYWKRVVVAESSSEKDVTIEKNGERKLTKEEIKVSRLAEQYTA